VGTYFPVEHAGKRIRRVKVMIQVRSGPRPTCSRTRPGAVAIRALIGTTPRTRDWITPTRSPLHR